jgi:hypothetical protein
MVGQDSAVDIATGYGLDGPGIESRWGARFSAPVQTYPGAHPASYAMGTGSFPGVKWPGRGVEHPPRVHFTLLSWLVLYGAYCCFNGMFSIHFVGSLEY